MSYGYTGKILHVDLTTAQIKVENPPEEFYRTYLGGSAMGLYYLLKNTPPHTDPLGPQNTLSFMLSPITGVAISGQSRATVTAKSPLTGLAGDAQSGGFWPAELKFAGFDGIVFTGKSPKPVYLWVHDGKAELRDASHLWGKLTGDTHQALRTELGDNKIETVEIGPAGEKLVPISNIMNMGNRAFGRTGMGAVMGSKNLKAIAVRGKAKVALADKEAVQKLAKEVKERLETYTDVAGMTDLGTAVLVNFHNTFGNLPTRNYTSGEFADADAISGETMAAKLLKHNDTCYACAVRCKRVVEGRYKGQKILPEYGGPEYETIGMMGSDCEVNDLNAICLANQVCAQYGVDTIACGGIIAFAMECFENGLLTLKDTGGVDLRFGNAGALVAMTKKIARRQGLGKLLGQGSAKAAKVIGGRAEEFAMSVKNSEIPAHVPQVKRSLALIYAVAPFGADHQSNEHDPAYTPDAYPYSLERMATLGLTNPQPGEVLNSEKVKMALYGQWSYAFMDCANLCQFVYGPSWQLYGPVEMAQLVSVVTGWDVSIEETQRIGERRVNMQRLFNAREGVGRELDTLPKRFFEQPLKGGPADGMYVDRAEWEAALEDYYAQCGWDVRTGTPTAAKLQELGLGWAI